MPVDCGGLGDPDNGQVVTSGGTILGSVAIYICNDGFNLDGSSMRTCQPDGTWSGNEPTCGKETMDKGYKLQEDSFHVRSFMQSLLTVVSLVILTMAKLSLLVEPSWAQ